MRERVAFAENASMHHINRIGYVSIFPLLLKLIPPESPRLDAMLNLIESRDLLWTDFGLRSIASNDVFYKHGNAPGDAPYWRGPIWININYLALGALYHYGNSRAAAGPYQSRAKDVYRKLRHNVQNNIISEYRKTGFFWEQYDDVDGSGQRGHPFTGWTTLVVNILSEKY